MPRRAASAVALVLAVAISLALAPGVPAFLRAIACAPLVLLLPGLALVQALFPGGSRRAERLLLAVGLSIAVSIVGGFVLSRLFVPLEAGAWAGLLGGVTLIAGLVAVARDRGVSGRLSIPPPGRMLRPALLAVLALVLTGGALALARTPLPAADVRGYTALWLLPSQTSSREVHVGIESQEQGQRTYRLVVREGDKTLLERTVRLDPGETFQTQAHLRGKPSQAVHGLLFAPGESTPYREVELVNDRPSSGAGGHG